MRKRSVSLNGHRTSIALEDVFWETLDGFAKADGRSLPSIISEIDRARLNEAPTPGLASALRVYILRRIQQRESS